MRSKPSPRSMCTRRAPGCPELESVGAGSASTCAQSASTEALSGCASAAASSMSTARSWGRSSSAASSASCVTCLCTSAKLPAWKPWRYFIARESADCWNVHQRRAGHGGSEKGCSAVAEYWYDSHDGLRLFSRVYSGPAADAPVVLCLHGLMRNSRDFGDLATHLAARYRVIAPDIRGRGFSDRDRNFNNYTIPVYLQDVGALLAGLGVTSVSIVGTSMGGLMAMVLAATEPPLVARIVLNDVGPEVDPAGLARIRGYAGKTDIRRDDPVA